MSVQNKAAILFFFSFGCYIYKEILQVWYFMVSTTVHF